MAIEIEAPIVLLRKRPYEPSPVASTSASSKLSSDVQQASKQFLRKTRQGRVLKVVREQYLRNDIPCGSTICERCEALYGAFENGQLSLPSVDGDDTGVSKRKRSRLAPVLSSDGRRFDDKSKGHYLVIDTNVALHQMDLLEHAAFGPDIIVLQTVLEEVRHRSLPLYNRLRALIAEEERRIWLFYNEACAETYPSRRDGESPNDRNDRAIREATAWYAKHLPAKSPQRKKVKSEVDVKPPAVDTEIDVILLSDDAGNRRAAQEMGLKVHDVRSYVNMMPDDRAVVLADLVAQLGQIDPSNLSGHESAGASKPKTTYAADYLPLSTLQAGMRAGTLHQGYFNLDAYNFREGSVKVPAFGKPILLVGNENMNRSVTGDFVVIEILPEKEWRAPADELVDNDDDVEVGEGSDDDDEAAADARAQQRLLRETARKAAIAPKERQPTGRVVGVIKRGWRPYVCHVDRASLSPNALSSTAQQSIFAVPLDRKIPKIRIRTRQASTLVEQKFLVSIDTWDVTTRHPEGHLIRALGKVETKEAEIESLLLEHDVPYRPFSKAILDCLPVEGSNWVVPPKSDTSKTWKGREDLRDLIICSIDPPGCQDIDDALHARQLANGNIEAGVHIADVSYFVLPDNPMDAEAESRGTTVYLVDKRIDMLPSLLGTNLCSLRPYVERLAFSVIWELDPNANIVNVRFTKSVIASKEAFTYEAAQKRKDDKSLNDPLTQGIRLLNSIAIKLRAKRMEAGALNLASPEVKIHMESSESTGPIDVEQKMQLETNSLVEEFMLLANISVAQKIFDTFPQTAVLRRHLPPPTTNFEVLADVLAKRRGMKLDTSSSAALADSLDQCIDPNMPDFNTLVRIMATRCMLSAEYFCSGSVARDTFGHYGLASTIYTHFTSPIRRFADVMVHRQLSAAVSGAPLHATLHSKTYVDRVMENINRRHRSAQQAGRASVEFYVALALRDKEKASIAAGKGKVLEEAFVIRAFRNGLAVFVSKFGLEGLITFKRDFKYDPETYELALPIDPSKPDGPEVRIGVFDKVMVEITVEKDKQSQRGRVRMHLVEPVDSRNR